MKIQPPALHGGNLSNPEAESPAPPQGISHHLRAAGASLRFCLLVCWVTCGSAVASSCQSDIDCSLNGVCKAGRCICDAPWGGSTCGTLEFAEMEAIGAYGMGAPFAVTSWGGNAVRRGDTWHLYVTEMAGDHCGLHVWGSQSTVAHATAPNASGPYKKSSTVLPHEAHNPETIEVDGALYIFHIGTADSQKPVVACNATLYMQSERDSALIAKPGGCPAAPAGFSAFPGHCVGADPTRSDCTSSGDGWQIEGGDCHSGNVHDCAAQVSKQCRRNPACHAFALHSSGNDCQNPSGSKIMYKLMRLGANSTVKNGGWVSYVRPGAAPKGPTHPHPPVPPSPPSPTAGGSKIHRSTDPFGPFLPVVATDYPGCNNPSPFVHKNGTLYLACTWSLHSAPRPEGPWRNVADLRPPSSATRHWEDPYLFINDRGFHILAHCYSMAPYPSNAISGHGFSEDGLTWHWSNVEPYDNTVPRADGTVQHFATMERPKFIYADAKHPQRPTHLVNGVSSLWNSSNLRDPCAACGHCSACKCHKGGDWTYTLARALRE